MITEDRLKHILGVARRCRELAEEMGFPQSFQKEMFTIGFLHDIGYEFSDNKGHAEAGADMLESIMQQGSNKAVTAIRCHGRPFTWTEQQDVRLLILNQADIETSPCGERITAQERLKDVAARYGSTSKQYADMQALCRQLCITMTEKK